MSTTEQSEKVIYSANGRYIRLDKSLVDKYSELVCPVTDELIGHYINIFAKNGCNDDVLSYNISLDMAMELQGYESFVEKAKRPGSIWANSEGYEIFKDLDQGIRDFIEGRVTPQDESMKVIEKRYHEFNDGHDGCNLSEGLIEQGREQGRLWATEYFIRCLLDEGKTPDEIQDWLDVSLETIQEVQATTAVHELAKTAKREIRSAGFTEVICPKCGSHPRITETLRGEITIVTCHCGYVHDIDMDF